MKKDLLFWCIAAFFTAMLCACGNKSDNKREIPDAGDSQPLLQSIFVLKMLPESSEARLRRDAGAAAIHLRR